MDSCARIAGSDFAHLHTRIVAAVDHVLEVVEHIEAVEVVEHIEAVDRHSTAVVAAPLAVVEAGHTAGANTVVDGIAVAAAAADTGDSCHHSVGFAARYEDYSSRFEAVARLFEKGADWEAAAVAAVEQSCCTRIHS